MPWKSSRASARASSCSKGSAWMRAVVPRSGGRSGGRGAAGLPRLRFLAAFGFSFLKPFLAALGKPFLGCTRVPQLLSWNSSDHHDLFPAQSGNRCISIGRTTASRSGRRDRVSRLLAPSSPSGRTGRVSRFNSGSSRGRRLSSSRLSLTTCCSKNSRSAWVGFRCGAATRRSQASDHRMTRPSAPRPAPGLA